MRKFGLFCVDALILYASLYITLLVRYGSSFQKYVDAHTTPFTILFALWILAFFIANLYDFRFAKNNIEFFRTFFYTIAINTAIAITFFYLTPSIQIAPRRNLFIFLILSTLLLLAWRWLFNIFLVRGGGRNNTLIIGNSIQSNELYDFLLANPQLGYNAIGILNIKEQAASEILEKLIRQKHVKTLILDQEAYKIPDIIDTLYHLLKLRMNFYALPQFYESVTGKIPLGMIDQGWFLSNLTEGSKHAYEIANRFIDVACSFLFGVLSSVFYPFIILGIKFSSPGPIFIRQTRVGRAGKTFTLYKFRSMIANAPDGSAEGVTGPTWSTENDSRVTKFGRFMRQTRIDEWPQIWNVLKGNLSFVGPRAERPEFHAQLKKMIPFYEERYLIKPGVTGWTQIRYRYGSTIQDAEEKLKYDLYYIKNRSLLLNVSILLKTINIVLRQAGQ